MLQVERDPGSEKDGELPALGADPKTVFPAVGVDVLLGFAGGDQVPVDPSETKAVLSIGSAGQNPPLEGRGDGHLDRAALVGKDHEVLKVVFQEGKVVLE